MKTQLKYIFRVILYSLPIYIFTVAINKTIPNSNLNPFVLFGIFLTMGIVTLPYDWGLGAYFLREELK